jgi:aminodeoxyfutalosine synthase
VHIVGGINPELRYEYYLEMIGEIRRAFASIIIKAFTASEIDLLAEISGLDVQRVLEELKDKGLNLLPGGGAEIFSSRVRKQLFPNKISAERWLEIHRIAHSVGLSSNATMLFGHIETVEERIDHIFRIRDLQEKTGGFSAFVPFPVRGFGTLSEIDGLDALRTLAMSRILLDNVEHIKVFWPIWGLKLTQLALSYGADDVDGTVQEYKIVEQNGLCAEDLQSLIREAGFEPVLGS